MKRAAKRLAVVTTGWVLLVIGIAAMPLPGPGLLITFGAVALLATQYEWAERRLEPVKRAAMRAAADSVRSPLRVALSTLGVLWLIGVGLLWGLRPEAPAWWPLDDQWWLFGGWGTGSTLIFSGLVAGALLVYSYRHFRDTKTGQPAQHAGVD